MLSKNITMMLDQMTAMSQSETQSEAVHDLRDQLDNSSKHQACLRCDKSGWTTLFDNSSKDKQQHHWVIVQTACGAYRSLPQDNSAGFEFSLATIYHCDAEAAGAGVVADDGEVLGKRWLGTVGEAERGQATPRRIADRDRG